MFCFVVPWVTCCLATFPAALIRLLKVIAAKVKGDLSALPVAALNQWTSIVCVCKPRARSLRKPRVTCVLQTNIVKRVYASCRETSTLVFLDDFPWRKWPVWRAGSMALSSAQAPPLCKPLPLQVFPAPQLAALLRICLAS